MLWSAITKILSEFQDTGYLDGAAFQMTRTYQKTSIKAKRLTLDDENSDVLRTHKIDDSSKLINLNSGK